MACLEPKYCECLSKCEVFDFAEHSEHSAALLPCDFRLLVLPNLKIFWDANIIKQQIGWAKEKLSFESQKSYEASEVWKTHVLGTKTIGVKTMQSYLGIQFSLVKATYGAKIQERLVSGREQEKCDIAKCMAYCSAECESQCESLDSTEESFLAEISWTKDMCDVESSKKYITQQCKDIQEATTSCDANCDGAFPNFKPGKIIITGIFLLLTVRLEF